MEKVSVYMYALIEADDWTPHSGLTVDVSTKAVRDDIAHNYIEPRYVRVAKIKELEPQVDTDGNVIGYARRADA